MNAEAQFAENHGIRSRFQGSGAFTTRGPGDDGFVGSVKTLASTKYFTCEDGGRRIRTYRFHRVKAQLLSSATI